MFLNKMAGGIGLLFILSTALEYRVKALEVTTS